MQRFVLWALLSVLQRSRGTLDDEGESFELLEDMYQQDEAQRHDDAAAVSEHHKSRHGISGILDLCKGCGEVVSDSESEDEEDHSFQAKKKSRRRGGLETLATEMAPAEYLALEEAAADAQERNFGKGGGPFTRKQWMLRHGYVVQVEKQLSEDLEGMNGALTVLGIQYKGPPVSAGVPRAGLGRGQPRFLRVGRGYYFPREGCSQGQPLR